MDDQDPKPLHDHPIRVVVVRPCDENNDVLDAIGRLQLKAVVLEDDQLKANLPSHEPAIILLSSDANSSVIADGEANLFEVVAVALGSTVSTPPPADCLFVQAENVLGALEQVHEKLKLRCAVQMMRQRQELLAEGASDALWEWNLRSGAMYYSPRWRQIVGSQQSLERPDDWFDRVHPNDVQRLRHDIAEHRQRRTPHFENSHRLKHEDGGYRWVRCRGTARFDVKGNATHLAGSLTNVTRLRMVEEQLCHDAFHDVLTGLPNRMVVQDLLDRFLSRSTSDPEDCFALLTMDIDRFGVINNSIGHSMGDQVLVQVARRLRNCVRPQDTVVRFGGDEFVVVLSATQSVEDALLVAHRIQGELAVPLKAGEQEVSVSASIGIAMSNPDYQHAEDLIRDAGTAMNQAKQRGRSRSEVFVPTMRSLVVTRMTLENDLRRAVSRNEFDVAYQPIVSLESGEIEGFEALLRWRHPTRGEILPADFIATAEENGLIVPIGQWVLRTACHQLARWQNRFDNPLSISVNLSSRQFNQPDLVGEIDRIRAQSGISAEDLRLEITESVMLDNSDWVSGVFTQLRGRNIQLHIDDFGTGYSSLSTLPTYPIDTLKVDRSFVDRMTSDHKSMEVVRTIVSLGRTLSMSVTAEGIETQQQLDLLRGLGCSRGQGFYFSKPVDSDSAEALIRDRRRW